MQCLICDSKEYKIVYQYPLFSLAECEDCGFIYQILTESTDITGMINEIYNEQWVSGRHQAAIDTFTQHSTYNNLLIDAFTSNKKGKLLEIGSGTGEFLFLAKSGGWDVIGFEPSSVSCQYAKQFLNLDLINDVWNPNSISNDILFDAITFWHVLEHVPNPVEFLQSVGNYLVEDGLIAFSIPNLHSFTNELLNGDSPLFTEKDHLFHYGIGHIPYLLAKAGMEVVSLFTREEFTKMKEDLAIANYTSYDLHSLMGSIGKLHKENKGHEIVCIARKRRI